jgi:thiamine pyrophosphokinase
MALDHAPDVVIGDLDSLPDGARSWLDGTSAQVISFPPAKDETDLELALMHVANSFDGEIWILGALGGRLDQTLANILLLAHPALKERHVRLVNRHERAWLVSAETEIRGTAGDTVSLIPLGDDVNVGATTGLRWPLQNEQLLLGPARGVSNVMTADLATVTVRSGRLLCIHTQQQWQR